MWELDCRKELVMFPPFTFFSLRYVLVHPLVFVVRSFGEKTEKKKGREGGSKRKEKKRKKREEGKRKETEEGRGREKNAGVNTFFFVFRVTVLFFAFLWAFFFSWACRTEAAYQNCSLPTAVPPITNFLTNDVWWCYACDATIRY